VGAPCTRIDRLREAGARRVRFVCLVAAPEGVSADQAAHPGVPIVCATLDRELDESAYIRPGLGDAGRLAVRDLGSSPPHPR
jgi:uracil phosphoribosyltransferase